MENSEKKNYFDWNDRCWKNHYRKNLSKEIKMNFCDIDFEIESQQQILRSKIFLKCMERMNLEGLKKSPFLNL